MINTGVSENTVKTHLASIYRKFGVERRAEALEVARRLGFVATPVIDGGAAPAQDHPGLRPG